MRRTPTASVTLLAIFAILAGLAAAAVCPPADPAARPQATPSIQPGPASQAAAGPDAGGLVLAAPAAGRQGGTLAVFVRAAAPLAEITGQLLDCPLRFFRVGDEPLYRALAGVPVQQAAGSYVLTVEARDQAGRPLALEARAEVAAVEFAHGGKVQLSPQQKADRFELEKNREANDKRAQAYAYEEPRQLWSAAFARPLPGKVISPFGKFREYNTGDRRHHLGVDFRCATGTPIHAPADGVVTLVEKLHLYGNAVILAHGQGVSTSYNHMSTLAVKVGQSVRRGDLLGRSGATGQATGPHLHWGMVVGGVAVDPMEWMERTFDAPEGAAPPGGPGAAVAAE